MGVSRETERIQADGQIAAYLCGAEDLAPSSTWYDRSLYLPVHKHQYAFKSGRPEKDNKNKYRISKVLSGALDREVGLW